MLFICSLKQTQSSVYHLNYTVSQVLCFAGVLYNFFFKCKDLECAKGLGLQRNLGIRAKWPMWLLPIKAELSKAAQRNGASFPQSSQSSTQEWDQCPSEMLYLCISPRESQQLSSVRISNWKDIKLEQYLCLLHILWDGCLGPWKLLVFLARVGYVCISVDGRNCSTSQTRCV